LLFFHGTLTLSLFCFLQGNRLGTADESRYKDVAPTAMKRGDDIPEPVLDKNLTDEDRAKIRADRAAAAEARVKKLGGNFNNKKATTSAPLTGPNSAPLMRWN
jgi:hypothetical protein